MENTAQFTIIKKSTGRHCKLQIADAHSSKTGVADKIKFGAVEDADKYNSFNEAWDTMIGIFGKTTKYKVSEPIN